MALLLGFLIIMYAWVILRRLWAWVRLNPVLVPAGYQPLTKITVIVAVRNERDKIRNLLQNLKAQKYPQNLSEIIFVDDHSEDNTPEIIISFNQEAGTNFRLIKLAEVSSTTGKKAAVAVGVEAASGDLLVFTDGDCQVQPEWLLHFEYLYTTRKAKFISGPVMYQSPKNLFQKMQLIEFASLIGVGGSSIALGKPNMCNGANLAYPKNIFREVEGFTGNAHLASGDDEFLMHKVQEQYPGKIYFLKARPAIVFTAAKTNIADLLSQRVRWASKWPNYQQVGIKILAVLVFSVNFFIFLAGLMVLFNWISVKPFLAIITVKLLTDLLFLAPVLHFFRKTKYLLLVLPLQLVYIPYVVITALAGLRGTYRWKGRNIRN